MDKDGHIIQKREKVIPLAKEIIQQVLEPNPWDFGNQVLYDMCQKAPLHVNEDEIIGKVWLIGRSYAAAIERGAKDAKEKGDLFYVDAVAKKIKDVGVELDGRIASLRSEPKVSEDLLGEIVETHHFLTKVFYEISGKENRSLASKYLHFHVPNLFYIYDTRATFAVAKWVRHEKLEHPAKELKKMLLLRHSDITYTDFVAKMYSLNVYLYEKYDVWLSPRKMDGLLLDYTLEGV